MSGHSKWNSIKHKKGAADAKRGKLFTRIIKELTVAARAGGADPEMNPRLRTVVADAKAANMPADNIKRAIRRGTDAETGVNYDEIVYEGYGPGGVAVFLEVLTDNRNRAVGEIRHALTKHGGNLGSANSVAWMFDKRGYLFVDAGAVGEEALMTAAIDAGADDFQRENDGWEILTSPEAFDAVTEAVRALGVEPSVAHVAMLPQNQVPLEGKQAQQMLKLLSILDDLDDIRHVWSNADISEQEIEASLA
ncbi:MAG: YebC/PmpR family DNA-binding transcriptional regulator [Acidobacteria bacterium]|nr:YebC/PmpR family DNA-binding transcriptional regulator [Acidobacteriota bacterium]